MPFPPCRHRITYRLDSKERENRKDTDGTYDQPMYHAKSLL